MKGGRRVPWLQVGDMRMILRSLVMTHYQCATDRQTDGRTRRMTLCGALADAMYPVCTGWRIVC